MTIMKFDYRLTGIVTEALAPHIERIFRDKDAEFMAVVNFKHNERHEFSTEEQDCWVKCRCIGIEIGNPGEQERQLRDVQRALFLQRTAAGKLTERDELTLAKQTLTNAQGLISGSEVARLTAWLRVLRDQLADARGDEGLDEKGLRAAIEQIEDRASGALAGQQLDLATAGA